MAWRNGGGNNRQRQHGVMIAGDIAIAAWRMAAKQHQPNRRNEKVIKTGVAAWQ